jgi:hypothetical protein
MIPSPASAATSSCTPTMDGRRVPSLKNRAARRTLYAVVRRNQKSAGNAAPIATRDHTVARHPRVRVERHMCRQRDDNPHRHFVRERPKKLSGECCGDNAIGESQRVTSTWSGSIQAPHRQRPSDRREGKGRAMDYEIGRDRKIDRKLTTNDGQKLVRIAGDGTCYRIM